jgi:hypothetical protein
MNGLNHSHKRTDVVNLLNPASHEGGQPSSIDSIQPQPTSHFQDNSQYHLNPVVDWDRTLNDPTKRRPYNGTSPSGLFHHSNMNPVDVYGEHPSRLQRPRLGDPQNSFGMDGAPVWAPPHEIANIAYGAPVVTTMFSDERTGTTSSSHIVHTSHGGLQAITGDYPPNSTSPLTVLNVWTIDQRYIDHYGAGYMEPPHSNKAPPSTFV